MIDALMLRRHHTPAGRTGQLRQGNNHPVWISGGGDNLGSAQILEGARPHAPVEINNFISPHVLYTDMMSGPKNLAQFFVCC